MIAKEEKSEFYGVWIIVAPICFMEYFPTKLGHFWEFYAGKYTSTMLRIWGRYIDPVHDPVHRGIVKRRKTAFLSNTLLSTVGFCAGFCDRHRSKLHRFYMGDGEKSKAFF